MSFSSSRSSSSISSSTSSSSGALVVVVNKPLLGNSAFGRGLFNKLLGLPGVALGLGVVVVVTFFGGLPVLFLVPGAGRLRGGLLNLKRGLLLRLEGSVVVLNANVVSRFSESPLDSSVTAVVKSFSSSNAV